MFFLLKIFRRDKLWIAMELCAGGSMQDIYHSSLKKKFF
jgi:hypothetical protein